MDNWGWIPGSGSLGYTYGGATKPEDWDSDGRHFDGINITFADGHTKWVKIKTVMAEAEKCPSVCNYTSSAWNALKDYSG